ncbi:Rieske 2Fe-2S domain-containing protein [Rhodococcus fascians]|nr:Rieske 2Fe-2S domain-containing protein [Rhodococcus fascians]MBY4417270.1 Rieske 2Fe-2S domain-containing protein [Rhodococcus fascians]
MTDVTMNDTDRVSESVDAGWQLPASVYCDPEVYATEKDRIFAHAWQYVGREKDLTEPGAYLTTQLGDIPVVIVRDKHGLLHGHVNVCRHRLHPVAEGAGCSTLLQCRYHGWTYTHEGSLRSAPGLQDEDAFDRQTLGLRPVSVDTLNGLVFANPDAAAAPLRVFLGGAADRLDELHLDFADWDHAGTFTYDIPANWKLFTENALECYHCPLVHETTYATAFETTKKDYITTEFGNAAFQIAPVTALTEQLAATTDLDGFRMLYLWPVSFMSVDDFIGTVARTVPMGSHDSRFVVDTFVKPGTDPAALAQWLDIYDKTFNEDKTVVTAQQAGYDSGAVPRGRLMSNCESTISMFQRRTWQALTGDDIDLYPERAEATLPAAPMQPAPAAARPHRGRPAQWEADLLIDSVTAISDGVVSVQLSAPPTTELPAWQPGAHIDVCLTDDLVRQYSLCGAPSDRTWTVSVLREPASRGGSAHVHDTLAAGQTLHVRGPRNHFRIPDAPSYRLVAGGIGITPIMPMVEELDRRGVPWTLLYGGRSAASLAFLDRLAPYGDKVMIRPQDQYGNLDLAGFLTEADHDTAVLACGPGALLDALQTTCDDHRLTLYTERFAPVVRNGDVDTAFDVVLARSGRTAHVEKGRSILEVVNEHGAAVLSSCREGTCGTCETAVVSGRPDHRDSVLTPDERNSGESMMICVSRCNSAVLTLDL